MDPIDTTNREPRVAIRLPFRMLAALILFFGVIAVAAVIFFTLSRSTTVISTSDAIWLPGMLWLIRLAFYACVYGEVMPQQSWPFASERVFLCYLLLVFAFQWA
jgi:hypothetical protein